MNKKCLNCDIFVWFTFATALVLHADFGNPLPELWRAIAFALIIIMWCPYNMKICSCSSSLPLTPKSIFITIWKLFECFRLLCNSSTASAKRSPRDRARLRVHFWKRGQIRPLVLAGPTNGPETGRYHPLPRTHHGHSVYDGDGGRRSRRKQVPHWPQHQVWPKERGSAGLCEEAEWFNVLGVLGESLRYHQWVSSLSGFLVEWPYCIMYWLICQSIYFVPKYTADHYSIIVRKNYFMTDMKRFFGLKHFCCV